MLVDASVETERNIFHVSIEFKYKSTYKCSQMLFFDWLHYLLSTLW